MNPFRHVKNERGNVLMIVSLGFTTFLGMVGLVIDGGMFYMEKTSLQKAANAAVLSGAQELMEDEMEVELIVDEVLDQHGEAASVDQLAVFMEERVTLTLSRDMQTAFMMIFGIDAVEITAEAKAGIGPVGRADGVAPLGIDESIELEYEEEYLLRVDEEDVDTGNFGILALEGKGANTYEDTLKYGSEEEFSIGEIVGTQTGNIANPTRRAIDHLISLCDDPYDRQCGRTILIPVYKPIDPVGNQVKEVEITGFAHFYILEPLDPKDTKIRGKFIERTTHGYVEEGAIYRGAFTISLME
ncbi:pilus assembly protein TadG-related protein [Salisediminibacterium beveridgei]|uniref:Putative Flp pilus-assembly TadG-like N-terminal domain-containing protein n=1 Tax=Salisediminibacterium beveridgei TaxID=632773 RepID=A0A1D7QXY2_9BACI|nr:Tad domain-containing protein [Salisediminibacterium beveridgei]AOM83862.1 hypothetical protein BBEV_2523 [Salisediminibacterium beveridgei]